MIRMICLVAGFFVLCCSDGLRFAAAQTVLVEDTFDVGAATFDDDVDDPFDVAWSGGFVIDDTFDPGIGDGNALEAGGDVWARFDEPATLFELDDFIRLSFDFRFFGNVDAGGDSSNGNFLFRVGLTDVPNEKTGYIIRIGTGGDGFTPGVPGNGIGLRQNDERAAPYVAGRGLPVQDDTFSVNDNQPHSASLTITMITGETTEDGFPTGQLPGVRLDGAVDDVDVSGEFLFGADGIVELLTVDHIYFDDRGPDFIIDNVKVETGTQHAGAKLLPGDVTFDGVINLTDPVTALGFLFSGDQLAECYVTRTGGELALSEAGRAVLDWTGDGNHNLADAVASLSFQFGGGPGHALGNECTELPGTCADVCR